MTKLFMIASKVLMLWLVTSLTSTAADTESSQAADSQTLKVITYNVQFLPGLASLKNKRAKPDYRAKRIASEMISFDIVALQETFEDKHRQQIIDTMRATWSDALQSVESPKPPDRFANGGCLILTRFPIVESHSMVFEHFSKPEDYGFRADGFAAKGVIHARIAIDPKNPDTCVDVFVTHLEARADDMRMLQYQEFADFVEKHASSAYPFLLLGDFNTKGMEANRNDPDSPYTILMNTMNKATPDAAIQDVWLLLRAEDLGGTTEQKSSEIGKRIDYIMLGNPSLPALQLNPKTIEVLLYQDKRVVALSDHNAVAAEFNWSSTQKSNPK